jgi:nucleotide-binding universal stress UspA family protein
MSKPRPFRVLFASDGSAVARTAVRVGARFPWPSGAVGHGVVAREVPREHRLSILLTALDQTSQVAAGKLRRALSRRWPASSVNIVDGDPVDAILGEAARVEADAIVVGWRGHGPVRRLLAGSVSRGVVRGAPCSVLVVHRSRPAVRRIVVGFDGSDNSRRAVELVARLEAPAGGKVILLSAVERLYVPTAAGLPSLSAEVAAEVRRTNDKLTQQVQRDLAIAARPLSKAGWDVSTAVTEGAPLRDLLATVAQVHADLLVVGARGASGIRNLLVGSVAEGALNRSPVPVLVAR